MINIYIATKDRKDITEFTLNNINKYKKDSKLFLYDDNSSEFGEDFLKNNSDEFLKYTERQGIGRMRKMQIQHFIDSPADYCYLTDNDTIHDENFVDKLIKFYNDFEGIVSIFNTDYHKTVSSFNNDLYLKNIITGNSIFFSKKEAKEVYDSITNDTLPCDNWDWQISNVFYRFGISKISYCEHLGWNGIHSSYDNPCRAINPTKFLNDEYQRFLYIHKEYK